MTITIVIINPQTGNEAGVWMMPCPEEMVLRIWGFWKRVSWGVEIGPWRLRIVFLPLGQELDLGCWRGSWVFRISTDRDLRHRKMHRVLGLVNIVRIMSFSSYRWTEVKKLIKRSYLNNRVHLYLCIVYVLYYICDRHHRIIQHLFIM